MPISRSKKDSLVDTQISENVVSDIKTEVIKAGGDKGDAKKSQTKAKKTGFITTTIDELKKVNWPGINYVLRWSGVIIMFTVVVALTLGFFDHLFTGGIKFVDCTSPTGQNQPVKQCGDNLVLYLTFRN
jgi:preprotein translocase SecE subunit